MAYSGKFRPKNPAKYKGNVAKIEYRSLWELGFMKKLDLDPRVARWNSEEVIIPYRSRADNGKLRRYFMDFWFKDVDGVEFIIEIKPYKETQQPSRPQRMTEKAQQRFMKEVYTYTVNSDKWEAAVEAAKKKGWRFIILTEKTLPGIGVKLSGTK